MPRRIVREHTGRFVIRGDSERKMFEGAIDRYREEGHNAYEVVIFFFGIHSSQPSSYLGKIKLGTKSVSTEGWNRVVDYMSKPSGK